MLIQDNIAVHRPNLGFIQGRTENYTIPFLDYCRSRGLAEATLDAYKWGLRRLPETLPTTTEELERLLTAARETLAAESVYDIWRVLKTFYKWAAGRYGIPNPMQPIRKPRTEKKLPKSLSRANVFALLNTAESLSGKNSYYQALALRNKLLILTPLDTGLRLAEITGLRKSCLGRTVRVMGKGSIEREVPITPALKDELESIGDSEHIWMSFRGNPMSVTTLKTAYRRIFKAAGVPGGAHSLRHTFATEYLRSGGDLYRLSRCLGHTTVRMTERYVHLIVDDLVAEHTLMSPALPYL